MTLVSSRLGDAGEKEVRARLERALSGVGAQMMGQADDGVDLIMQFRSPAPGQVPIHFGVQVKTGVSFAEDLGSHLKVRRLDEWRFAQWQASRLPILLVWVMPGDQINCYWKLIRERSKRDYFLIHKQSQISPATGFELSLRLLRLQKRYVRSSTPSVMLKPPFYRSLREWAKSFYSENLMREPAESPLLGKVDFTWLGWRKLTKGGKNRGSVARSLSLLGGVRAAIKHPHVLTGFRRLNVAHRGNWTTEVRLVALESRGTVFSAEGRTIVKDLVVVLRERIRYPRNWLGDLQLYEHVFRDVTFEGVHERGFA